MTSELPPTYYFTDINYNSSFYGSDDTANLTEALANSLYLRKTVPDTATAVETFSSGITTNTINSVLPSDLVELIPNGTGILNIGASSSRTSTGPIVLGNLNSLIRFGGLNYCQVNVSTQTLTMRYITEIEKNSIFIQIFLLKIYYSK